MSKHKGHEQHEIEDIVDMVDHINNLPDCLIHHILSFMPTKEAVKTSILSTRWKNLWTSVPIIDFDDGFFKAKPSDDVISFMKFVERVLRLRDASNMKKFSLTCYSYYVESQLQAWISHAIMHNVQELDLSLLVVDQCVIPSCAFNSISLDTLKIEMYWVILPSHISFPCLKTLHLSLVTFQDDDNAKKIFSGCPVLENLVLSNCRWSDLENIVISSSTLKSLTIHDWTFFEPQPLDDGFGGCKIKVDAANLTYFEYTGYLVNEILLNNVSSSLVKACIHISTLLRRQKEVACPAVVDLLKQLQYVMSLSLSNDTMRFLIDTTSMLLHFPVFPNLIHLVLTTEIVSHTFGAVMDMLYFCPILQSICLSERFEQCMDLGENDRMWLSIPICVSNCLKTVTFKNFHAKDSEICFLKRVLKYARVLERMNICWSKRQLQDLKKRTEVRKELETIGRSSRACVVKFS